VPAESRRNLGGDPGRDEVDPGQELLAVIVIAQLGGHRVDERVPRGVVACPLPHHVGEKRGAVRPRHL
jgi:hypothetical protein